MTGWIRCNSQPTALKQARTDIGGVELPELNIAMLCYRDGIVTTTNIASGMQLGYSERAGTCPERRQNV